MEEAQALQPPLSQSVSPPRDALQPSLRRTVSPPRDVPKSEELTEELFDKEIEELEARAAKLCELGASFVSKERLELNFLIAVERLGDLVCVIVKDPDRSNFVRILGEPYTRFSRMRYMLDVVTLCDKRVADRRWLALSSYCDIAEAVLRDLDPKKFRDWRQLQADGVFVAAFADPDANSDAEDEEAAQLSEHAPATEAPEEAPAPRRRSVAQPRRSVAVPRVVAQEPEHLVANPGPPVRFASSTCGAYARIVDDGLGLSRQCAGASDPGQIAGALDAFGSNMASLGLTTKVGRAALFHVRQKVALVPDDGGTAITEVAVQTFGSFGKYAEISVTEIRPDSAMGCVGIGLTTRGPEYWQRHNRHFPARCDSMPCHSWVFSGPYKGWSRRLYIDGQKDFKFTLQDEMARWKEGDRIGILANPGGKLGLYVNGSHCVTVACPDLADFDVCQTDLHLVVEAFGYVLGVAIVEDADPNYTLALSSFTHGSE